MSSRRRATLGIKRVLHVLVMALNFIHQDCAFVPLRLLRSPPNTAQQPVLTYLEALVRTYGSGQEGVVPSSTGRRMNVLHARLCEVSEHLTRLGSVGDAYRHVPSGEDVPADTADEALQPCRALDAARLKLVGRAQRDPQPWLSDDLWMAYAEPQSLLISRTPAEDEYPDCSLEDPEQTLKLALLWDSLGLLVIVPSCLSLEGCEYTRIFNARKSAVLDRQIGDRRGRNSIEARICGPSASLPTGESLTSISIDPRTTSLAMGVTDRRDFYRQLSVDGARAVKNRLYPPLSAESLAGTKAMKLYQEPPGQRIPLTFQACFSSVLQGDHLGVEFATSAHLSLLQGAGLLTPATRIMPGFRGESLCAILPCTTG